MFFGLLMMLGLPGTNGMLSPQPMKPVEKSIDGFAIVELFTSQGCSSCPEADAYLSELTRRAAAKKIPLFTLSFHVDYWDYLGWRDPFADKAYTDRQRAYARFQRGTRVYTPQMVVNGEYVFVGSDKEAGERILKKARRKSGQYETDLKLDVQPGEAHLGVTYQVTASSKKRVLNLAVVESHLSRQVKRGENRGRRLDHDHVVRAFVTEPLRAERQGRVTIALPKDLAAENASLIAYIQEQGPGKVVAARMLSW